MDTDISTGRNYSLINKTKMYLLWKIKNDIKANNFVCKSFDEHKSIEKDYIKT